MPSITSVPEWLQVCGRSTVVYLALLAGLRIAGKRHSGQISPHDFVLILLVSNAVQNAMVGSDTSLTGGLAAAATLITLNVFLTRFVLGHRRLSRWVSGEPTLLIHNGRILNDHLARECILPEELEAQIRAHGFEDHTCVKSAVQETDGSISVIGFGEASERRLPGTPPPQRHGRAPRHR